MKPRTNQNPVIRNIYSPARKRSYDNKTVAVKEVIKREYYEIVETSNGLSEIKAFAPKSGLELIKNQQYGNSNVFVNSCGLVKRVNISFFDKEFLPFNFHTYKPDGTIDQKYAKLNELRKRLPETKVLHRMNTEHIPIEDKLENYIHIPHIDSETGRETSFYDRYPSNSSDGQLGRVLNWELHGTNFYSTGIQNANLLVNPILKGCIILFELVGLEDADGISKG